MKKLIAYIGGFDFSLEDIIIADVMNNNDYFDTEHKRGKCISRDYTFKNENDIEGYTLYKEIGNDSGFIGHYFLQYIAHTYSKLNRGCESVLVFIEEFETHFKFVAIPTVGYFDEKKSIIIELKKDEDGNIEKYSLNKLDYIFRVSDFMVRDIVVFTDIENLSFLENSLNDNKLYMDINYKILSQKEIKDFFNNVLPFKKNNSLVNFSLGILFCFLFIIYGLNAFLTTEGVMEDNYNDEIEEIEGNIIDKQKLIKNARVRKEDLFYELNSNMLTYIPGDKI